MLLLFRITLVVSFILLSKPTDALESLGLAARSPTYRSAAYTEMARLMAQRSDYERAADYAEQALDYNRYNVGALQVLAVALRQQGQPERAEKVLADLLETDPLCHFARFERYLIDSTTERRAAVTALIRHELPYQTSKCRPTIGWRCKYYGSRGRLRKQKPSGNE